MNLIKKKLFFYGLSSYDSFTFNINYNYYISVTKKCKIEFYLTLTCLVKRRDCDRGVFGLDLTQLSVEKDKKKLRLDDV